MTNQLAVFADIDITEPLRDKPRKTPRPQQTQDAPERGVYRAEAKGLTAWFGKKLIGAIIGQMLIAGFIHQVGIKKIASVVFSIGHAITSDKRAEVMIDKVLDSTEETVVNPPKLPLAARILLPMKEAAVKPIEAIKEGGKKAVDAVEVKVDEVETKIEDKARDVTTAIVGMKTSVPGDQPAEQPGIIATVKNQVAVARNAVASQVQGAFGGGEKLTPEQAQKRRDYLSHIKHKEAERGRKIRNQQVLGVMGARLNSEAAGLAAQADQAFWNNTNANLQQFNQNTQNLNQHVRRNY